MKINQSTLSMDAYSGHRDVVAVIGRNGVGLPVVKGEPEQFRLELEADSQVQHGRDAVKDTVSEPGEYADDQDVQARDSHSRKILQRISHEIMGREVAIVEHNRLATSISGPGITEGGSSPVPFDMFFNSTRVTQKTEKFDFASSGHIETADGRSIEFSLDLSVSRVETSIQSRSSRIPRFLDPLVLSFDDGLSSLSGTTFSFDLTGDGILADIGALASGSGFLSLDLNEDGKVNSGLELFGPSSGHGFAELGNYDWDTNGWIDENDPVFEKLKVWFGAGGDDSRLISLKEAGVGAISLSSLETHFDLKNDSGVTLGRIVRAGLFVMENGEPRSLQEIDLNLDAAVDVVRGVELPKERVESIDQAIFSLRRMIRRRRRQLEYAVHQRLGFEQGQSLSEKFWQWQERRRLSG